MKHFAPTSRLFSTGVIAVSLMAMASVATAVPTTIRVTVQNLAPQNGNFLTPVWSGFHDGNFDLYDIGAPATPGLERLAEDGNTGPLSGEFLTSGFGNMDGTIFGPSGPFAPGEVGSLDFTLESTSTNDRYYSYASMVIPSNDAFIANGDPLAHRIFADDGTFLGADFIVFGTGVRDAGTEVNDEIPMNTAFLGQAMPDMGVTEGGTVQIHGGFIPNGNILTAFPGADFTQRGFQVARITVNQVPEPSMLALLTTGLIGVLRFGRRKRNDA